MLHNTSTPPRVYVGTYGAYNSGSLKGQWLDLGDYSDAEEFNEACKALHSSEDDPEFMFQDWEGIPEGMISESSLDDDIWEWLRLDDHDKQLLSVYREYVDRTGTLETAQEAYSGTYTSPKDWAEDYLEGSGILSEVPQALRGYFDFAAYARRAGFEGMTFAEVSYGEVWVFHSV
jgi:antirestriction protein